MILQYYCIVLFLCCTILYYTKLYYTTPQMYIVYWISSTILFVYAFDIVMSSSAWDPFCSSSILRGYQEMSSTGSEVLQVSSMNPILFFNVTPIESSSSDTGPTYLISPRGALPQTGSVVVFEAESEQVESYVPIAAWFLLHMFKPWFRLQVDFHQAAGRTFLPLLRPWRV